MEKVILWLRNDLRLADNPALQAAAQAGQVIPVFILDDAAAGQWQMGGASRWWLHQSLADMQKRIPLVLGAGDSLTLLRKLCEDTGARRVFWNRRYEPWAIAQDTAIKDALSHGGIAVQSFNAALLFEPWEVKTGSGGFYKVFTPFWKACVEKGLPQPVADAAIPQWSDETKHSITLESLQLLPAKPDWAGGLRESWQVGEAAAQAQLAQFLQQGIAHYSGGRDLPARPYTSRLSPYLRFGQISPRQIVQAVQFAQESGAVSAGNAAKFLAEIGWREFSYHLLYHVPHLPEAPFRPEFAAFPWQENSEALRRWQRGQTGYPIVDAGMRELWHSGVMHNRVRMIAASFLTKHLLLPWQEGARWFWDTLVDADLASNSASWQWVAGCGADAAPYFRIFNPMLQGQKFAAEEYIRRWVPELRDLSDAEIHTPWLAKRKIVDYPPPLIDHASARNRALTAYKSLKE